MLIYSFLLFGCLRGGEGGFEGRGIWEGGRDVV